MMDELRLEDLLVPRVDMFWSHLVGAGNHRSVSEDEVVSLLRKRGWLVLANGERVEWCEFHDAQGTTLGYCYIGATPYSEAYKDCRIVSRLLAPSAEESDYPKEAENE